jgi:hypothetical protein
MESKAPDTVLVADSPSIQKIIVTDDLPKDPIIASFRTHPNIPTLFLEVDKASHKHTVNFHK